MLAVVKSLSRKNLVREEMQFGLPTGHDGHIFTEKNLVSCRGIRKIPFNASVSDAEFQQAKPTALTLTLCGFFNAAKCK